MRRRVAAGVMLGTGILWGVLTHAQAKPATSSPGGDPETTSDFGKNANWQQMADHQHGSLAFTGRVAMAQGALPWDPIPIVVVCGGRKQYNTQADQKGRFRIEPTVRASEVSPDKPGSKSSVPAQLIGCSVRAELEGFQSSSLTIANRTFMDDADIGTLTLTLDEKRRGSAESSTTATAPKEARKAFDKARAEANEGHAEGAQKDLEKAVHLYPQFAEAWYQLGKMEEAQKPQEAAEAFAKAVAADPQFVPAYMHVALLAAGQKKWQAVVEATGHSLELEPAGTPQVWYLDALGHMNLGEKEVAEKSAMQSLAIDPGHVAPNTEQLLAVILASRGDYAGAVRHLQSSLTYTPPGPNADLMRQQVEQLQKLAPNAAK